MALKFTRVTGQRNILWVAASTVDSAAGSRPPEYCRDPGQPFPVPEINRGPGFEKVCGSAQFNAGTASTARNQSFSGNPPGQPLPCQSSYARAALYVSLAGVRARARSWFRVPGTISVRQVARRPADLALQVQPLHPDPPSRPQIRCWLSDGPSRAAKTSHRPSGRRAMT